MFIDDFQFRDQSFLFLLFLLLPIGLLAGVLYRNARQKIITFSKKIALDNAKPALDFKLLFFLFSLAALIIALARPQGDPEIEERTGQALDIIVMLDVSKSMAAEDMYPNRLGKAKRSISAMLNQLDGDRVGLVAFAGSAVLVSPLTNDYSIVRTFLNALSVDTIENQGTDIAATIQTSIQAFRRGSARNLNPEDKSHVLILISDGEITSGEIDSGLKLLKENQMILHSIGVGSDKPSPIAIRDVGGNLISYKQDRSGNTVLSSMNESTLKSIAGSTGGIYALSRADDSEIGAIVDGLQKLNRSDTKTMKARIYQEYFQWPLGLGILFFIAIFLLPLFTGIRGLKQTMIFLICTLLGISNISYASSIPDWLLDDQSKKSKTASELFSGEKFSESTSIYKSQQVESPDSKEIAFNTATSLLKEGKKDEARAMLESLASENNSVSSLAQFNLAGSLAEEKKYDEALARYASLAQNLTQKNPRTSNDDKLLTETTKKIELVQKRREEQQKKDQNKDKNKENQEEDKKDKKEDKKDQQGSGNDKESDQANKNDDPSKQEDKDNSKGENEKKDQQQKQQPKFDQRKKFKENETLNEGDAKKILEALRQQEQLLQKKMLQQKTITPRSAPSNGKDW